MGPKLEGREARQRRNQDLSDGAPEFFRKRLEDFPRAPMQIVLKLRWGEAEKLAGKLSL